MASAGTSFLSFLAPVAGVDFALQWIGCGIAIGLHTEKYYDLTGSITFALVSLIALVTGDSWRATGIHPRQLAACLMVLIWCCRLGLFLFSRIQEAGEDKRFKRAKQQGLWVLLTSLPMLVACYLPAAVHPSLGLIDILGIGLWVCGFGMEVVADQQKNAFRRLKEKPQPWIDSGLWSVSRHPNYLGEMLLWCGLALAMLSMWPVLSFLQIFLILLSPTFVCFLLLRVSGIPLLEKAADKKWGDKPKYQAYKEKTACLIPGLY